MGHVTAKSLRRKDYKSSKNNLMYRLTAKAAGERVVKARDRIISRANLKLRDILISKGLGSMSQEEQERRITVETKQKDIQNESGKTDITFEYSVILDKGIFIEQVKQEQLLILLTITREGNKLISKLHAAK